MARPPDDSASRGAALGAAGACVRTTGAGRCLAALERAAGRSSDASSLCSALPILAAWAGADAIKHAERQCRIAVLTPVIRTRIGHGEPARNPARGADRAAQAAETGAAALALRALAAAFIAVRAGAKKRWSIHSVSGAAM